MNERDDRELQKLIDSGLLEMPKSPSPLREDFPMPTFEQVVEQYKERMARSFLNNDFSGFKQEAERE